MCVPVRAGRKASGLFVRTLRSRSRWRTPVEILYRMVQVFVGGYRPRTPSHRRAGFRCDSSTDALTTKKRPFAHNCAGVDYDSSGRALFRKHQELFFESFKLSQIFYLAPHTRNNYEYKTDFSGLKSPPDTLSGTQKTTIYLHRQDKTTCKYPQFRASREIAAAVRGCTYTREQRNELQNAPGSLPPPPLELHVRYSRGEKARTVFYHSSESNGH